MPCRAGLINSGVWSFGLGWKKMRREQKDAGCGAGATATTLQVPSLAIRLGQHTSTHETEQRRISRSSHVTAREMPTLKVKARYYGRSWAEY